MRSSGLAALFVALVLTSCGGSRSPSGSDVVATDDLGVTQSGPATVGAGGTVTFTAVVANGGKNVASDVTITETLTPPYTATVTCVPSFGATCPAQLGAVMTVPSLSPGRWLTLTYVVAVPLSGRGDIVHKVEVSGGGDSDPANNASTVTTSAVDARTGAYKAYAADGRQYDLTVDFDAQQYTMSGNGQTVQKTFTQSGEEFVVNDTARFRVAEDLLIGGHDFGAGVLPFVAARSFVTSLGAGGSFNLATRNVAADGSATTHPGTARISGNVLSICQTDSSAATTQTCPVVLTSYVLSGSGDPFTGVETTTGEVFTFRLARSGSTFVLLSALTASDGSQQLRIGLLESPGLAWGTVYGPTDTGDWVTMVLDPAFVEYAVLGTTTNDQAGLQKIANSGPFAMMVGKRLSDSADIFVLQTIPLVIVVGAFDGTANGTFQVAVP